MLQLKPFILKDFCLKCKYCCRFTQQDSVWAPCLLDEEIQVLLDKNIPSAYLSLNRKILLVPSVGQNGFICPFLNEQDNKCKIYEFRPFECQLYPFLINLRGKKVILTVDLNCLYIKENLKSKEFKEYTEYLSTFLNSAPQIKLLKENPQVIQTYEGILDLFELG